MNSKTPKFKKIYSPDGEPVIATYLNAYDLLLHAGFTANPPKPVEVEVKVEELNVVIPEDEDEADPLMPDFAAMTKEQLEEYAISNYGVEIDKRKSQANLADKLVKLWDEHNVIETEDE